MYTIDPSGKGRGTSRRPIPAPLWPLGLLLFLTIAAFASSRAVFPLLPLLLIALFVVGRRSGPFFAWRAGPPATGAPAEDPHALPSNGSDKEKELLRVLERYGEITAARVALETSLGVSEAEEMLSRLASNGHVRVIAKDGSLSYSLWE